MAGQTPLVITLWETYGSNMEAVAEALAADLKLPLHKQAYSSEAIEEATAEREREGALGRLLRNFAPANFTYDGAVSAAATASESNYAAMAEENTAVVRQAATVGGVIQGRNGQYILRDRPNTLHVKLDGIAERRARRAAELAGIPFGEAVKRQELEDDVRVRMSLEAFQWDPRDIEAYDAIVNTSFQDTEETAQFIAVMARVRGGLL